MSIETITVLRDTTPDDWGQRTRSAHHTETGWSFAPAVSNEDTDKRNLVVNEIVGYGPADSTLTASDVIERPDGRRWELLGEVGDWGGSPFGSFHPGVEARFRRVTG